MASSGWHWMRQLLVRQEKPTNPPTKLTNSPPPSHFSFPPRRHVCGGGPHSRPGSQALQASARQRLEPVGPHIPRAQRAGEQGAGKSGGNRHETVWTALGSCGFLSSCVFLWILRDSCGFVLKVTRFALHCCIKSTSCQLPCSHHHHPSTSLLSASQLFNLDARQFITQLLAADRPPLFTRVVMNLPSDAIEFLGESKTGTRTLMRRFKAP